MTIPGVLTINHWRKSSQWFVLTREHAVTVRDDTIVDAAFRQYCVSRGLDLCCSDEYYIPTLLAVLGRSNETNCAWGSHFINWCGW